MPVGTDLNSDTVGDGGCQDTDSSIDDNGVCTTSWCGAGAKSSFACTSDTNCVAVTDGDSVTGTATEDTYVKIGRSGLVPTRIIITFGSRQQFSAASISGIINSRRPRTSFLPLTKRKCAAWRRK